MIRINKKTDLLHYAFCKLVFKKSVTSVIDINKCCRNLYLLV